MLPSGGAEFVKQSVASEDTWLRQHTETAFEGFAAID
jgi:hypothetical protein